MPLGPSVLLTRSPTAIAPMKEDYTPHRQIQNLVSQNSIRNNKSALPAEIKLCRFDGSIQET